MHKALFLDRDGVINVDNAYVHKPQDFIFVDGIFSSLKKYQDLGYLLIVVTNQSGINRGYYSLEDFLSLSEFMKDEFKKHGVFIDKIYHCPHTPDEGCECRKPSPKMLFDAKDEFGIDMENSIMIGDKLSDMKAGFNAGVKNLFLIGKEKGDFYENIKSVQDSLRFMI